MMIDQKKNIVAKSLNASRWCYSVQSDRELHYRPFERVKYCLIKFLKGFKKMSEEKGNLKGLAISFILISLIMSAGVGIVYFVGQSIY